MNAKFHAATWLACALAVSAVAVPPESFVYQGRLVDSNEMPVTVATEITFTFFDAAVDGNPLVNNEKLFSETDLVTPDANGIFTTIIGDNDDIGITAAGIVAFDEVWLNINVEGEDLTPRQQLFAAPYALRATTADEAIAAETAEEADHAASADMATFSTNAQSASDADTVDGLDASDLAPVDHEHSAADITSGVLADARIPTGVARDNEVFSIVLGADGSGSGLDADRLDGFTSSDFVTFSDDLWVDDDGDNVSGFYEFSNPNNNGDPVIEITNDAPGAGLRGLLVRTPDSGNWLNAAAEFVAGAGAGTGVLGRATGTNGKGGEFEGSGTNGTGVVGKGNSIDFFADGAGTNYAPFTGAHEVRLSAEWQGEATPGLIVSATGVTAARTDEAGNISLSSTLPEVALADTASDKRVLGVVVREHEPFEGSWYTPGDGERFALVNALGEGRVWVCTANGEIEAGDYITTSAVPGFGQLQDDDLQHNYTVGKVIERVDWDAVTETVVHGGVTYKAYLVAVVYTCG